MACSSPPTTLTTNEGTPLVLAPAQTATQPHHHHAKQVDIDRWEDDGGAVERQDTAHP